ncbi:hypothetical protein ACFYNO_38780 [Kitasatospora sp. NPDC006697]|uniref:hypothetical protein n=1 Tax=Kitasatospora sp. NPDC006697 TaxID=3364020 RepID=UPI0036757EB4
MSIDFASARAIPVPVPVPGSRPEEQATGPYRMTVTTRQSHLEAAALADQCLGAWLKHEGYPEPPPAQLPAVPPEPAPAERLRPAPRVLLDRDDGPLPPATPGAAPGRYTRRRLRTPAPHGSTQLSLTIATEPGGPSWVRLEADHLPAGAGLRTTARVPVPGLARRLLPLLDALDGSAEVRPHPRLISAADVDEVIDELCDPARRLPTVVASVPADLDPADWTAEVLHPLMTGITGLAVGYVLDPSARVAFNIALEYHTVYGGAVRTYLPEVDPASRRDALRHLVLPRHRIEAEPRRAAALLAREPRRLAGLAPLPGPLARVPELRVRAEDRRPLRLVAPPAGEQHAMAPERPARDQEPARPAPHRCWRGDPHPCQLGRGAERGWALSSRLCRPVEPAAEDWSGPGSFSELLGRMDEFPLLSFTGDEKETLALEHRTDNWVRLTWEGLTALQEYAAVAVQGEAGGDFKQWCERASESGSHFPPRKAVRGESRTVCTHTKMRRERMFAVPPSVDPSGRAFMGAHLRIGGGRTAPRLHYLDDCSGSGRIYVGYIGMHLTNTMTN